MASVRSTHQVSWLLILSVVLAGCNLFAPTATISTFEIDESAPPAHSSVTFVASFETPAQEFMCRFDFEGDSVFDHLIENCSSPLVIEHVYPQPGSFQPSFSLLLGQTVVERSLQIEVQPSSVDLSQVTTAVPDSYSLAKDTTLTITAPGVMANDLNTSGYTSVVVAKPKNSATFSLATNGSFTYKPKTGFVGPDSFTYQLKKSTAKSNTVTVSLIVSDPVNNDPPVNTLPLTATTSEETPVTIAATVADPDLGIGELRVNLEVTAGSLSLASTSGLNFVSGDGTEDTTLTFTGTIAAVNVALSGLKYLPSAGFTGSAKLTLTTNDQGNSGSGGAKQDVDSTTITIRAVAAVPSNDAYTTRVNRTLTIPSRGILANDTRLGSNRSLKVTSKPTKGTLILNNDGSFTYKPNKGFTGKDSFKYTIAKGSLVSVSAMVSLSVEDLPSGEMIVFSKATANFDHTCGLTTAGEAHCWGEHWVEQGGNMVPDPTPLLVPGGHTFYQLESAVEHDCGLTLSGQVYCWGRNVGGALGSPVTEVRIALEPIALEGNFTFRQLVVGGHSSCGLTFAGEAYCWGYNRWGQLGNFVNIGDLDSTNPTPVPVLGGILFTQLVADEFHTCGLSVSGQAYCWGNNGLGQLGNGSIPANGARPGEVGTKGANPTPIAVWGGLSFTHLAAGAFHTCGLTPGNQAYCWGWNRIGQLGQAAALIDLDAINYPLLVSDDLAFVQLTAGVAHTCGLTPAGKTYCWGSNRSGQLGSGTNLGTEIPNPNPLPVDGDPTFTQLTSGSYHTCGVTANGKIYCWGSNWRGQLGNPTNFGTMNPNPTPLEVIFP